MNTVFASGVMAIAMGETPVATPVPTWEVVPVLVFTEKAVTFWSPTVATHMKWFVVPLRFAFAQPAIAPARIAKTITRPKELVRILLPLIEDLPNTLVLGSTPRKQQEPGFQAVSPSERLWPTRKPRTAQPWKCLNL